MVLINRYSLFCYFAVPGLVWSGAIVQLRSSIVYTAGLKGSIMKSLVEVSRAEGAVGLVSKTKRINMQE